MILKHLAQIRFYYNSFKSIIIWFYLHCYLLELMNTNQIFICKNNLYMISLLIFVSFQTALRFIHYYLSFKDGRKEEVHFDKITSRIQKLCYGLDMEYIDPVSIFHLINFKL